jgi:peptidoglycan hydrolase-like protein with peptidoglycan-binding domain
MNEGMARSRADRHTGWRPRAARERRPDRVALWAVFLGLFATVAAAASAQAAGSGGIGDGSGAPTPTADGTGAPPATGECPAVELGSRPLRLGDCGTDVQTLNLLLSSKPLGAGVAPDNQFGEATDQAVKAFQAGAGLNSNGVVASTTRKTLKRSMNKAMASWYGPGFFGNETSCGVTLEKDTIGVAHRTLPCGTQLTLFAHGHWANAEVIDRGPFAKGIAWDLTQALAVQLGVEVTEKVRVAVAAG